MRNVYWSDIINRALALDFEDFAGVFIDFTTQGGEYAVQHSRANLQKIVDFVQIVRGSNKFL